MKYLLILITLITGSCTAQNEVAALERAKDYINCKITYLVIVERHKDGAVSNEELETVKPDLEFVEIEKKPDFDRLSKLLSGKFQTALQQIALPIDSINVQEFKSYSPDSAAKMLTAKGFELLKKNYGNIYDVISENQDLIESEVARYLNESSSNAPAPQPFTPTSTGTTVVKEHYSLLNLILNIISILGLIIIFLYFKNEKVKIHKRFQQYEESHENNREIISSLRKKELNTATEKTSNNSQLNLKDLEKYIINSDYFQNMGAEVQAIKKLLNHFQDKSAHTSSTPQIEKTDSKDIFYMSGPVNNYFHNSAKSLRKDDTVYKFTVSANKQEATFETHNGGAPVSEILKRSENYLKAACEEENLPDSNTKNIVTKKKGTAVLEGDKWVIKTKALIRYE